MLSIEERVCETLFQESTLQNNEGRFIVKLPTKNEILSYLGERSPNVFGSSHWKGVRQSSPKFTLSIASL